MGTVGTFLNGRACSNTLFHVIAGAFGDPLDAEEQAAMPLAGGIIQHGHQCGMVWGAALAAGSRAYRLFGKGPEAQARAILAARRLTEAFRADNGSVDCADLTALDDASSTMKMVTYFVLKGGTVTCVRRAASTLPWR